jgi:molybdopterin/thiamine biosynthesis adenylyltransferase/rhodanese-related sulfurtransferase
VRHLEAHLEALRAAIPEVDPAAAAAMLAAGASAIDVREPEELDGPSIPGAHRLGRGFLEMRIAEVAPSVDEPLVLVCESGTRSLLAASSLLQLGYTNVHNLAGGLGAWRAEGRRLEVHTGLSADARVRYDRHLRLPEVGAAGQQTLLGARVLCIGAGGLGSPAALYLAAAGVGTLGIVDDDRVDRSNLQRQILHSDDRVGTPKVRSAEATLRGLNPDVRVQAFDKRVDAGNVAGILEAGWDVVVDGADNFPTRYVLNDACLAAGIPLVYGAVHRFEGQLSVFCAPEGPCYRCLYPEPPPSALVPNCAEAGVLGVLPGVIGLLQATEALKLLLGLGHPLTGRLLTYDALAQRFSEMRIPRDPECPGCGRP